MELKDNAIYLFIVKIKLRGFKRYFISSQFSIMVELLPRKFMILLEISTGDYHNLGQIAEKIGITKQGVHEYVKKLREEGLIEIVEGKYRVTVKGVEAIFSYLDKLDSYLKEKKERLSMMEYCAAIAGDDIRKG